VLIGEQADADGTVTRISAEDWAVPLDTIAYEIVCGIGPRVPRFYQRKPS
jgi:alanine racemase